MLPTFALADKDKFVIKKYNKVCLRAMGKATGFARFLIVLAFTIALVIVWSDIERTSKDTREVKTRMEGLNIKQQKDASAKFEETEKKLANFKEEIEAKVAKLEETVAEQALKGTNLDNLKTDIELLANKVKEIDARIEEISNLPREPTGWADTQHEVASLKAAVADIEVRIHTPQQNPHQSEPGQPVPPKSDEAVKRILNLAALNADSDGRNVKANDLENAA